MENAVFYGDRYHLWLQNVALRGATACQNVVILVNEGIGRTSGGLMSIPSDGAVGAPLHRLASQSHPVKVNLLRRYYVQHTTMRICFRSIRFTLFVPAWDANARLCLVEAWNLVAYRTCGHTQV